MVKRQDIQVGDYIINNDPRGSKQPQKVVAIFETRDGDWLAEYNSGKRRCRVRLDRIFKAGEKCKNNTWTLAGTTE